MNRLPIIFFLVVVGILGVFLGVEIGTGEFEKLGIYLSIGVIIYFFAHGWRNVWWLTALLFFSGVTFMHGFEFNSQHLFVMMLALASCLFLVSRGSMARSETFARAGVRPAAILSGIVIVYGILHFFTYYAIPYSAPDYSVKTSTKAYFECYASMVCMFWLMVGPYGFTLKPKWWKSLLAIIWVSLLGNIALRGFLFAQGFQAADGLSGSGHEAFAMHVPIINMFAGVYTLRIITPIACVIFLMVATAPGWWRSAETWLKALIISGLLFCLIGAMFGGGRATLIVCIALAGGVAFVRRKVVIVGLMVMSGVLVVGVINVFSTEINMHAPYYVARSMQLVMWDKGSSAETITDSQSTRNAAMKEAIVQWRKDNRVLFFGRSVFSITWDQALYMKHRYGVDGFVENAMRGGRTHNLVTDLLLQYGLLGLILYLSAYVVVIRFVIRLFKVMPEEEVVCKSLIGAMAIYLPLQFLYQLLGGNYLPMIAPLIVGLVRSHLVTMRARDELEDAPERVESQGRGGSFAGVTESRG